MSGDSNPQSKVLSRMVGGTASETVRCLLILMGVGLAGTTVVQFAGQMGTTWCALAGIILALLIAYAFSENPGRIRWRTVLGGMALQVGLAMAVLWFQIGEVKPGRVLFEKIAELVKNLLAFSDEGGRFVFGPLADPAAMGGVFEKKYAFVFAFQALPVLIFVSALSALLYHLGVLQWVVKALGFLMRRFMGTSGSETLCAVANVFLGQTEAPLVVKPYILGMTKSELLALMAGGMATMSGALLAVYIDQGADAVALMTTSLMAAPCGLYLSKIVIPETEKHAVDPLGPKVGEPGETAPRPHRNVLEALSAGTSEGLGLALNIAAMMISFLALLALLDALVAWLTGGFTLASILAEMFRPVAILSGFVPQDAGLAGELLGKKLVANEFVAFSELNGSERFQALTPNGRLLACFALSGFANLSSIGIQIGGIGAMAPSRRGDLSTLGAKALLVGFLTTLINAALAAILWR
jgi:CNT family concentrative nucleoside transporter